MFGKTSVSIYFLSNSVQIFQLNSNKGRVIKRASIDLPEGLIKNHKIADKSTFASLLKEAWKKLQIKEKSVFLVIPEFSTFTKLIDLSGLKIAELQEAVGWQVQDYLPTENQEMIMDFKIVDKLKDGYKVLVVALEANSLKDFVDTLEAAGLFPINVEIPSISLTRLTEGDEKGKIIVYLSSDETIIVAGKGSEIYASSVVVGRELEEIEKNIKRIINHFTEVEIKTLYAGGEGIHIGNFEKIAQKLKLELKLIDPKLKGITSSEIQNYLVSYSSQLQTPSEPSDPLTLNLLPIGLVEKYQTSKKKVQAWSLTLTTTLFVWISFFITLAAFLFMNQQIKDIKALGASPTAIRTSDFTTKIESINKTIDRIEKIREVWVSPEIVLNEIANAKPQGITIANYIVDYENGKIRFSGISANRETLVSFKQNLMVNTNFVGIEMPITSFEAGTNLEFEVSLEYLPIVSINKAKIKTK